MNPFLLIVSNNVSIENVNDLCQGLLMAYSIKSSQFNFKHSNAPNNEPTDVP
jgi:hypothetical protein